jgi:hypothetical protein
MNSRNRTLTQGQDQQVLEGVKKDLQDIASLYLGGRPFTPATLEACIQARIDAASEIAAAKAQWEAACRAYDALDADTYVVIRDLKQFVIGAFGDESAKLADFGFTARKPVVWTEAMKAKAAVKRAATRKARGTLGPKAKLAIKGVPPTTPTTPPATP